MRITYLGQCCFLIEADGVRIVTDPHLSDCLDDTAAKSGIPWKRLYAPPCSLFDAKPDIVLISHAHPDHMDLKALGAYRAAGGNAIIAAPAPTIAPLKEMGFSRVVGARAEHIFPAKGVTITPLACAHTELAKDEAGRFLNLSYLIDFGDACAFFGGDMSLYDGLAERVTLENCQALLLPCNGRDEERTKRGIIGNTTAEEAAAFAADVGAPFIPMHHDLYAINGRPLPEIEAAAKAAGADMRALKPGESADFTDDDD